MVALYQISTNTIVQSWGSSVPDFVSIPGVLDVHCPTANWAFGDYMFIPVIYTGTPNSTFSYATSSTQTVSNNILIINTNYLDPPLSDVQANLCSQMDAVAEKERLQYITPGSGQVGTYILMLMEAKDIAANSAATANDYPLNASQIGLPGITTIQESANITLTQASQWIGIASTIEGVRLSVKSKINLANTIADAIAAFNTQPWPNVNYP